MIIKLKEDFTSENITLFGKNVPPQPLKAHIEGENIITDTEFSHRDETKLTEIVLEFERTDAFFEYLRKYSYTIDTVPKVDDLRFNIEVRAQKSVIWIYGAMFSEVSLPDLDSPTRVPAVAHINHEYFTIQF